MIGRPDDGLTLDERIALRAETRDVPQKSGPGKLPSAAGGLELPAGKRTCCANGWLMLLPFSERALGRGEFWRFPNHCFRVMIRFQSLRKGTHGGCTRGKLDS